MKPFFIFCWIFFSSAISFSQKETSQWFVSGGAQYFMSSSGPQQLPPIPISSTGANSPICNEGGQLLFFLSHINSNYSLIYDRNYKPLPFYNDKNNYLYPGTRNAFFIKRPGHPSQYYLFHNGNVDLPANYKVLYTLVDLSLNGGTGDVVESNVIIDGNLSNGFTIVKKNEDDFWLITHKEGESRFDAREVTSAGISSNVTSSFPGINIDLTEYGMDQAKASPDGNFIAVFFNSVIHAPISSSRFIQTFKFDHVNGKLNPYVKTTIENGEYFRISNMEFSADNRLLYVMHYNSASPCHPSYYQSGNIMQYNLCYSDSVFYNRYAMELANSYGYCNNAYWGEAQLAPDKKIYTPFAETFAMSTIQAPNRIGTSSSLSLISLGWETIMFTEDLPNFYHSYVEKAVKNNIVYSGGCYPAAQKFQITNDTITAIKWTFGDALSGASNTSVAIQPSHQFSSPGFYTVSADLFNSIGNKIETVTELIEIKNPAIRLLTGLPKDTAICDGEVFKTKLSVINGVFHWSIRHPDKSYEHLFTADSINIGEAGEGTYIVEMRQNDCDGCVVFDSINVRILRKPVLDLGADQAFCEGDSILLLTGTAGAALLWNTSDTTSRLWIKNGGFYLVTAEYDHNSCIAKDSITITEHQGVNFSLPPDTILCNSETITLKPTILNSSYIWQDNSTNDSLIVNMPGTYWVKITNSSGCFKTDTIKVAYVSATAVNLGSDTTLCKGDSLKLAVNILGASYLWSNGSTADQISVKTNGTYWVKVNNKVCTIADTINIAFIPHPIINIGNDTTICSQQNLLLNAGTTYGTYQWQDGTTNAQYTVTKPGSYWIKVNDRGCTASDTINVTILQLPAVNIGNDTILCENKTLALNAGGASIKSWQWQDGTTLATYTITRAGLYTVNVLGNNGCINSDSIQVQYQPLPIMSLGKDTALCQGENLLLQVDIPNATYQWQDASANNYFNVKNEGLYWLKINENGCSKTDSIFVSYKPKPVVHLGNDTSLCNGSTLSISAFNPGAIYHWQDNSSSSEYTVTDSGTYVADVSLSNCSVSDTIKVIYIDKPTFTLGADTTICTGQQMTLVVSQDNAQYLWQDNSTGQQFIVRQQGLYTVKVTNKCGEAYDDIKISQGTCTLILPTAFTPNGDGLNEKFSIKYPLQPGAFKLIIYNRWGQKIFETTDVKSGWDGKFLGVAQPMGTYIYTCNFTVNGIKKIEKGSFVLIR